MDRLSLLLVIIGAINWGLVGFARFDLVAWIFGGQTASVSRIVFRTPVSAAKASFRQQSRSASSDESAYSPDAYFISHRLTLPSDRSMTRSTWAPRRSGASACVRQE